MQAKSANKWPGINSREIVLKIKALKLEESKRRKAYLQPCSNSLTKYKNISFKCTQIISTLRCIKLFTLCMGELIQ